MAWHLTKSIRVSSVRIAATLGKLKLEVPYKPLEKNRTEEQDFAGNSHPTAFVSSICKHFAQNTIAVKRKSKHKECFHDFYKHNDFHKHLMYMSDKEKIIEYLLTKERFGDNCIHFTQACYDKFSQIPPKEIESILLLLADEGFIECRILTHREKPMCWIRLKAPILNYKEDKKKAHQRSIKALWDAIDSKVRWAIGCVLVPIIVAIAGWLISRVLP